MHYAVTSSQAKEHFLVLVADDSEPDRIMLKRAMQRTPRLRIIGELNNGADVISYLKGRSQYKDREKFPLPDLLLLDLKMPLKDGFEVLSWLGTQYFKNLTVVVLTDSMHAEHIKRALDLGADLFQVKPRLPHELVTMVGALEERLMLSFQPRVSNTRARAASADRTL